MDNVESNYTSRSVGSVIYKVIEVTGRKPELMMQMTGADFWYPVDNVIRMNDTEKERLTANHLKDKDNG